MGPSAAHDCQLRQTQGLGRRALGALAVDGLAIAVGSGQSSWQLVHATDLVAAELDELRCTLGEGPGLNSYLIRKPILVADLQAATAFEQWPGFAHEAPRIGARAIFAFPLVIEEVPFGIVEFYCRRPRTFNEGALADARRWVDDLARAVLTDLDVDSPTGGPLTSICRRSPVAQATGMISVQLDSSIPDAFVQLRARAFAEGRLLSELANDVLARRYAFTNDR